MKITFLGAAHEVTGSCTLIEVGDKKGIVDCGMEQGKDIFVNQKLPVDPSAIDFVLVLALAASCGNERTGLPWPPSTN